MPTRTARLRGFLVPQKSTIIPKFCICSVKTFRETPVRSEIDEHAKKCYNYFIRSQVPKNIRKGGITMEMKRRGNYIEDIKFVQLVLPVIIFCAILTLLMSLLLFSQEQYFGGDIDPDTRAALYDLDNPVTWVAYTNRISYAASTALFGPSGSDIKRAMTIWATTMFFLILTLRYWGLKKKHFYFCDLPFEKLYGKVLFVLLLPLGGIFMLISYLLMDRQRLRGNLQ